jgi:putative endopeptidase
MRNSLVTTLIALLLTSVLAAGQAGSAGRVNKSDMDETCQPCENFYQYANGGWIKKNPTPAAYSRWGRFSSLSEANVEKLRPILEDAAAGKGTSSENAKKLGDLYAAFMDESGIESAGLSPIQPLLTEIDRIKEYADIGPAITRLHARGILVVFSFSASADLNNSKVNAAYVSQGGLGLPDRDYYLKDDNKSKEARAQYTSHIAHVLQPVDGTAGDATAQAESAVRLETRLAQASMGAAQMRDAQATNNRTSREQLRTLTVNLRWDDYLRQIGQSDVAEVIVRQPAFFKALDREIVSTPIADWKIYLRWQVLHRVITALPSKFEAENFRFYDKYLSGVKEALPRWRRAVSSIGGLMPDALGAEYVNRYFPPEAKVRMTELVENLRAVLRDDIAHLDWMTETTRKQAIEKLQRLKVRVGYPEKWRDYSDLKTDRSAYANNLLRTLQFSVKSNWDKIGKPVDLGEWPYPVWLVDAFAGINVITFPAGILQPPFFDRTQDDAANYGAIGAVIGHEITHHFDDSGRRFDAKGNLRDWWTSEDAKNYSARAECVEHQFAGYQIAEGIFHNGKLILGEAISDLGGLKLAYLAYQKSIAGRAHPSPVDGLTGEQRFFLSYGSIWGSNNRPESDRLRATMDPHPLERYRVNGTVSNMIEFAAAFHCKTGDPMVRTEKCQVW